MADDAVMLGIDVGSSSVKVCAYRRDGTLLARSARALTLAQPRRGQVEMDAESMWRQAVHAVRDVSKQIDGHVLSIGISSACPTIVFLDAHYQPVRPAIVYLDNRSIPQVARLTRQYGLPAHFARSGNRPGSSTSWLSTVAWVREHEPDVWQRVSTVTLQGGFFTARLTGQPVIDWTQASYSGGFRVDTPEQGWDEALLDCWQMEKSRLAPVAWSCLAAGALTDTAMQTLGIRNRAQVAVGCADTAASAFALGTRRHGQVFESSGTSGVITFCLDRPDFDDAFMNRCHIFPQRWLAHGAMSTLGGAFAWLLTLWPDIGSIADLERLAASAPPGANGLVFLPYLAGERSPVWDANASAVWAGLRLNHTRADMARAVFEGTAFGLKQIFERGKKCWGVQPDFLLGVGGGARSALWTQIKNEVLGVPYGCVARGRDTAALGAALVGAVAAGVFAGTDDPDIPFIAPPLSASDVALEQPRADATAQRYARAFQAYDRLYGATREVMHMLSDGVDGVDKPVAV